MQIPTAAKPVASHHYIIAPISGRIKVTLNLGEALNIPKTSLQLELPELQLSVEENQYHDLLALWNASVHYVLGMEYRKFLPPVARPTGKQSAILFFVCLFVTYSPPRTPANAAAWWAFAFRAVRSDLAAVREKWRWRSIKQHKQDRLQYISLWRSRKKVPPYIL